MIISVHLVPGQYQVAVEAPGYLPQIKLVNISQKSVAEHKAIVLNFELQWPRRTRTTRQRWSQIQ